MKGFLRIVALGAAAAIFAACSGTNASQSLTPSSGVSNAVQGAPAMHANDNGCGGDDGIRANDGGGSCYSLVAALQFNGSNFTLVSSQNNCGWWVQNAPAWTASSSGTLTVAQQSIPNPCGSSTGGKLKPSDGWGWGNQPMGLYIIAFPVGGGYSGKSVRANDGHGWWSCGWNQWWHHSNDNCGTLIAGPATFSSNPWVFNPLTPGLTTQAGSSYEFFVAEEPITTPSPAPSPIVTPAPATWQLLAPLSYSNGTLANVSNFTGCSNVTTTSAPSWTATSSGAFALTAASVSLPAICPNTSGGDVYAIAVQLTAATSNCNSGSGGGGGHGWGGDAMRPNAGATVQGWNVAGPAASPLASTLVLTPQTGNFVTQACATYGFFLAQTTGGK